MQLGFVGSGYVGLVAACCFADSGQNVLVADSDPSKIKKLKAGEVPFYEPGLPDLLERNRERLQFFDNTAEVIQKSKILFIAVGTPELPSGEADMSYVLNATQEICKQANEDKLIVIKSTVPIGSAQKIQKICQQSAKHKITVFNNPEFLRQGSAVEDFLNPDRVIIGFSETANAADKEAISELYRPFLKNNQPLLMMDNSSAELSKYAANCFLAMKISFINEMSLLADRVGADINNVRAGFTSDHRINPAFFNPGIGYGGSCFPKDVKALVHLGKTQNLNMMLLDATNQVNERQKTILVDRVEDYFKNLQGKTIAIWGLSFKPRTDDVRRAPSIEIIRKLVEKGAKVKAYDPVAMNNTRQVLQGVDFELSANAQAAATGADALLILTEWNEFQSPNLKALKQTMKKPLIFDGRNLFSPRDMKAQGFEYFSIGRRSTT